LKSENEDTYKQLRRKFSTYSKLGFEDFLDEDFINYLKDWIGDLFIAKTTGSKPTYYYWNGDIWTNAGIDTILKSYVV